MLIGISDQIAVIESVLLKDTSSSNRAAGLLALLVRFP
jgi:hypothetical protein